MSHLAGSARSCSFDGISYRPVADAVVQIQNIRWKRERVLTYGSSYEKVTPQECYIAGLKLECDMVEYDTLKQLNADVSKPVKCSVTLADGSMVKGEGSFAEISELDAMEGVVEIKFSAVTDFAVFTA